MCSLYNEWNLFPFCIGMMHIYQRLQLQNLKRVILCTHIVILNVQLITKLSMLLTFLSIWMSVIVSETSIIIRYFHELFCVIFLSNGILCMHSFSSIMMGYVIVQPYARYFKGIEVTNVKWYFINNDIYQKQYYHRSNSHINMFLWDCANNIWRNISCLC